MGFISDVSGTISDAIGSEFNDQYLEAFRTDSLGQTILVKRAYKQNARGLNQGSKDVISAGSKVLVPEGAYALMVDDGKIVDSVTEPGMYTWENSSSGSVFSGGIKSAIGDAFDRFRFAGEVTKIQKIYFVNGLEIMNQTCNEYLNVVYPDPYYGNLYFKFRITFSFRIVDPVRFFNRTRQETTVSDLMGSPSSPKMPFLEVQDHMDEALNLCAVREKIPFPKLLSNKSSLTDAVNETVSKLWYEQRGMVVESIVLTGLTLDEASRARVEQIDSAKLFADDQAALGALVALGFTDAKKAAASNSSGSMGSFAGIGMGGKVYDIAGTLNENGNTQTVSGPETCPFCGTLLNAQIRLDHCPACNADIRTYYSN